MKKINIIGSVAVLAGVVGPVLYRSTGLKLHIIISIVALVGMLVCMVAGRKSWKKPIIEILYRLFYLVALITGFVLMSGNSAAAVSYVHKGSSAVFAILFIVSIVIALIPDKK